MSSNDTQLRKAKTFRFEAKESSDEEGEPVVRRSTTLAEKRAIYSHTRALLAKIRFQRPLSSENDDILSQSSAQNATTYASTSTNWKKLREFVSSHKKVRKTHDVMQIWLQVHQENTQRKLLEALTEFMQSEALRLAAAAEAAELFRAAEAAAQAAAEAQTAREAAEEAQRARDREKKEIFDIQAFSKQAANMMESLANMQKEQDQLLREVEELQANMALSSRRAGRLVQKIQESDMADTVNAIRALAAEIPDEEDEEENEEEEEQEEEMPSEVPEPVLARRNDRRTSRFEPEKIISFEQQREELIEKVVEIELLLVKSRRMQSSQESFAQEMKENLCPLLPRMRPRCDLGHLMNEAPGRCPTALRCWLAQETCCSCGLVGGSKPSSTATTPTPSAELTLEKAAGAGATHWVCQDCLFQSHMASWMCHECSLEHQKTEMGRVAATLEAKAERSNVAELQAIVDTIDPSLRLEAKRRLRERKGLFVEVEVVVEAPLKRPQFVRKEKPKKPRPQMHRRESRRESLLMKPLDLGEKFLAKTPEPEKESPKEISPRAPSPSPAPEIFSLPGEVAKITVEDVVLERALGKPEKEIICSSQVRTRRNQLALEASEIAKRLAQTEGSRPGSRCESSEMPLGFSSSTQQRVEQAALLAWKERVDRAEVTGLSASEAFRTPSPRPMISPVELFSPSPLESPKRSSRTSRPFAMTTAPNVEKLSLRPWRHSRGADALEPFDEVLASRPSTAPTKVPPKAGVRIRSVEQWLKVLMPKANEDVPDQAEARP